LKYHYSRTTRNVIDAETGRHDKKIKGVEVKALGKMFDMILRESHRDVLSPLFQVHVVDKLGVKRPFLDFDKSEFLSGNLRGDDKSQVSAHIDSESGVMTATITTDDEVYVMEPIRDYGRINKTSMTFYKTKDVDPGLETLKKYRFCDSIDLENETFLDEVPRIPRDKRSYESTFGEDRTRCNLRLVADYHFFNDQGKDVKAVVSHLISVIDRINKIYLETEFADVASGESSLKGYGFFVQDIVVHNEPSLEEGHYNSVKDQWAIRDLLEAFSKDRTHKWYCLSHLFTHQKFESGVLGLAFVAHTRKLIPGGVCTQPVTKGSTTYYYNTGVTTTKNSVGNPIFTRITDLITAHELGHNWGAEHDPDLVECSPRSSYGGAFLMHTYSLAGYEGNNRIFSPCSKRAISNVLRSKAFSCFVSPQKSFCGNGIVEDGEECDGGQIGGSDSDPCCTPECRLKPGATCSDLNHLCCEKCRPRIRGSLCREGNPQDCKESTHCDGINANCPVNSPPVADGRECLDQGRCSSGACVPFCESNGLMSCMCDKKPTDYCIRCCRQNTPNSTCERFPGNPLRLKDGTPCVYGFCDRGYCRRTNQDTIRRLWGVIDEVGNNGFLKMLKDNIVFTVAFILLCFWVPTSYYIKTQDDENKRKILAYKKQYFKRNKVINGNDKKKKSSYPESTPKRRNGHGDKARDDMELSSLHCGSNNDPIGQPAMNQVYDETDKR
jgi:disintegrin and metalloproteinase domain-containing protein 17